MSTGRREREEQGRGGSRKNGIGSSRVARLRWCVVCRGPRRRMRMEGTLDVALWQGTQEGNRQRQDLAAYLAAASDSGQTPPPPTLPLHLRWSRAKHTLESWQQGKLSKVSPALSRAKPYSSDSRDIARYRADRARYRAEQSRAEQQILLTSLVRLPLASGIPSCWAQGWDVLRRMQADAASWD